MPRSKAGIKKKPIDNEAMKGAIQAVISDNPAEKMTIREAAKVFTVSRTTVSRQLKKLNNEKKV